MQEPPLPEWPAPERNKAPILEVLRRVLKERGLVVEVAAGTGQHAEYFARALQHITYQPTDMDDEHLATLTQRCQVAALANLRAPVRLDARDQEWSVTGADAVFCANMLHIAPWEAAEGLFAGAGRILRPDGRLITYGPYRIAGEHTAESNARFDASLKQRNPAWGIRDLNELDELAIRAGLRAEQRIAMPANNFTVVWRARSS